jgi:hypothetical protein
MRDWTAIAAGLKIELGEGAKRTLEGLDKSMLGLRGLIDWQEEPVLQCSALPVEDDTE